MRIDHRAALAACALAATAFAATGCGSTVGSAEQASVTSGATTGGYGSPEGAAQNGLGTTDLGGSGGSVAAAGGASSASQASSAAPGITSSGGSGTTGSPSSVLRGTKTPIKIGYLVAKDTAAAFAALGYNGISSGNGQTQVEAAVKLLNSHGGIGGRTIVPVTYQIDATKNLSDSFNAACALFFQDNHVAAVVSIEYHPVMDACSKKAGVPYIADATSSASQSDLAANPLLVLPNQLAIERASAVLPQGLVANGWLDKSKKPVIGLITVDDPSFSKVQGIVSSTLSQAGFSLKDTSYMPSADQGYGAVASAGKATSLKFKSEGIDHVISIDTGGFDMSWFTLNAGQQGYYPKLGMSTFSAPGAFPLIFNDKQLNGSAAVGWEPLVDVGVPQEPILGPRVTACLNAMKAAGENMNAQLARLQSELVCDGSYFLADTFKTGTVTGAALQAGINALTQGFDSLVTFKSDPRNSRAAASAYRNAFYSASCKCYSYSGGTHAI